MQQIFNAVKVDSIKYPFQLIEDPKTQLIHVFDSKEMFEQFLTAQFKGCALGKMSQKQIDLLVNIMQQVG